MWGLARAFPDLQLPYGLLVLLVWSAFLASPLALLGPAAFVLYIKRFQIAPEERAPQGLFGGEYLAYKSLVRRWL